MICENQEIDSWSVLLDISDFSIAKGEKDLFYKKDFLFLATIVAFVWYSLSLLHFSPMHKLPHFVPYHYQLASCTYNLIKIYFFYRLKEMQRNIGTFIFTN